MFTATTALLLADAAGTDGEITVQGVVLTAILIVGCVWAVRHVSRKEKGRKK